jgi:chorismate dehydratase
MQDECVILPDFCLSSIGYVKSVVLQSRMPIEELNGRRVGLTTASETSVALLKVLLSKYYRLQPVYVPVNPKPDFSEIDAALVIGNEAMLESEVPVEYSYDLGDLWLRKTGHPVVFAVFLVRKEAIEKEGNLIREVCKSYRNSLQVLNDNRALVVSRATAMYPEIKYDICKYYGYLKFEFSNHLKHALKFYYEEAAAAGVLTPVKSLEFAAL